MLELRVWTIGLPVPWRPEAAGRRQERIRALEDRLLNLESKLRGSHSDVAQPEHSSPGESADDAQPLGSSGNAPASPEAAQPGIGVSQTVEFSSSCDLSPLPRDVLFRQIPDRIAEIRARDSPGSFRTIVTSPILPGNAELALLEASFGEICKELPLFDTREFLNRVRNQGAASIEACGSASRWACVNAAIALSAHLKVANYAFGKLSHHAWAHFKNAYAVSPELMLQGNDSETVKALVLMASFGRNSADTRTTSLLLSTALRLSQTLDSSLFRDGHGESHNTVDSEKTRLAVWAAYVLDAELSLCCGLSSALGAGDLDIDLPNEEYPHDGEDESCASIFRRRVALALIHSEVGTRLYSRGAVRMPESELLSTIVTLSQTLEDWRRNIPPKVQLGHVGVALEPHCAILHLAFHNLTSMAHWAARRHSTWDVATRGRLEEQSLSLMNLSRLKVRTAAQETLRLLQQSPFEQFAQFWRNLSYPLSAAMTLLLYILECPEDRDAEADAELLRGFGREVTRMQDEGDCQISNLLQACLGLEQLANVSISQVQNDQGLEAGADPEPSQNAFLHDAVQTFRELLSSATHPMYVAQALLTNVPNRDIEISHSIARILGVPLVESEPYGPLVSECVKPGTYGFGFSATA
ncbi:hypothetical protein B0I37DRAFT_447587 [Chaetomium sp. MPI-CAGE-AT-0009]|nr:hypothetical protein B0I37DRAFT_447587 [Chaetomium sp. MPI-CAGE-AT-0009]